MCIDIDRTVHNPVSLTDILIKFNLSIRKKHCTRYRGISHFVRSFHISYKLLTYCVSAYLFSVQESRISVNFKCIQW